MRQVFGEIRQHSLIRLLTSGASHSKGPLGLMVRPEYWYGLSPNSHSSRTPFLPRVRDVQGGSAEMASSRATVSLSVIMPMMTGRSCNRRTSDLGVLDLSTAMTGSVAGAGARWAGEQCRGDVGTDVVVPMGVELCRAGAAGLMCAGTSNW